METSDIQPKILPGALVRRLPIYYRNICSMEAEGVTSTTSKAIAKKVGNTSAQVRQDFFTCGGVPGYSIKTLKEWLGDLIGLNEHHHMVVVGAGNLGRAIISFSGFNDEGFFIDAAFDNNLMLCGMQISGVPIMNVALLEDYLKNNKVDILVITTSASSAKEIYEKAVACGVKGIWNFSTVDLVSNESVNVQSVSLGDSLMMLAFRMKETEKLNNT